MDYAQFIDGLRPLLEEARDLFNDPQTHQAPRFRKWRHAVTTLMSVIEDRGYTIDCSISSRHFQIASYGPVSRNEQIARYNQDLQDTINEIESIVRYFDKYGDFKAGKSVPGSPIADAAAEQPVSTSPPRSGSLKEKFESHPVVWGLTLLAIGFGAGFAARAYFPSEMPTRQPPAPLNCRIEGVDRLEEAHYVRVEAMQKELLKLEESASDRTIIGAYQDKYKEAADRVRKDITIENAAYQSAVQQLSRKCQ